MSVKFLLSLARLPGTDFLTNEKYIYKNSKNKIYYKDKTKAKGCSGYVCHSGPSM